MNRVILVVAICLLVVVGISGCNKESELDTPTPAPTITPASNYQQDRSTPSYQQEQIGEDNLQKIEDDDQEIKNTKATTDIPELDSYLDQLQSADETIKRLVTDHLRKVNDVQDGVISDDEFCEHYKETKTEYFQICEDLNELGSCLVGDVFVNDTANRINLDLKSDKESIVSPSFELASEFCEERTALIKSKLKGYLVSYVEKYSLSDFTPIYAYYSAKKQPKKDYGLGDSIITNGFEIKLKEIESNAFDSSESIPNRSDDVSDSEFIEIWQYREAILQTSGSAREELIDELESKHGKHIKKFFEITCEFTKKENLELTDGHGFRSFVCLLDDENDKSYAPVNKPNLLEYSDRWQRVNLFDLEIAKIDFPLYVLCMLEEPGVCPSEGFAKKDIFYYEYHPDVAVFKITPSDFS